MAANNGNRTLSITIKVNAPDIKNQIKGVIDQLDALRVATQKMGNVKISISQKQAKDLGNLAKASKGAVSELKKLDEYLKKVEERGKKANANRNDVIRGDLAAKARKDLREAMKPLGKQFIDQLSVAQGMNAKAFRVKRDAGFDYKELSALGKHDAKAANDRLRRNIIAVETEAKTRLGNIKWGPSKDAIADFDKYKRAAGFALSDVNEKQRRLLIVQEMFGKKIGGVTKEMVDAAKRDLTVATSAFNRSVEDLRRSADRKVQSAANNGPKPPLAINYLDAGGQNAFVQSGGRVVTMLQRQAVALNRSAEAEKIHQQEMDKARRTAYAYTIAGYQLQNTFGQIQNVVNDAAKAFSDFDYTVRRAGGSLSVFDTSSAVFNDLSASIENTAIATKMFDPKAVAEGYYFWGSTTGQVVKSQEDLLRIEKQVIPIMQAAAITQTDMESSLKGVYSILQQYGKPMEDAEAVTQKLFLVTQKTAVEFPDLIESFKMVGPIAASVGVSFEDVIGMLGALGNAGVRGSMAGRALRQTFVKLTDPTVRASKALDSAAAASYGLGTSFNDLVFPEGQFVGMQGYLDVLTKITKNLTQEERNRLLGVITTQNELPALIKLLDANAASYTNNSKGIIEYQNAQYGASESTKYFTSAVKNQMDSPAAAFAQFSNTAQSVFLEFGRAITDIAVPALNALQPILMSVLGIMREYDFIPKVVAAITMLAGAVMFLTAKSLIAAGAVKLLRDVILQQNSLIPKASRFLLQFGAAMGFLSEQQTLVAATSIGGKFATDFTASSAAATRLATNVKGLGEALKGVFAFGRGIGGPAALLATLVAVPVAMEVIKRHGAGLAAAFGKLVNLGAEFAAAIGRLGADFLDSTLGAVFRLTGEIAVNIVDWADRLIEANFRAEEFGKTLDRYSNRIRGTGTYGSMYTPTKQPAKQVFGDRTMADVMRERGQQRAFLIRDTEQDAVTLAKVAAAKASTTMKVEMAAGIRPALIAAFKSGDADLATRAIESAKIFLKGLATGIDTSAGGASKGVVDGLLGGINNLFDSDNQWSKRLAASFSGLLGRAFATGSISNVNLPVNQLLATAKKQIESDKPALRATGADALYTLLSGFTNVEGVDQTLLGNALLNLAKPGSEYAGYEAAVVFLRKMGLTITTGLMEFGKKGEEVTFNPLAVKDIPNVPTSTTGTKQESPLEKALGVAQQAADLAEALQRTAGMDLKAMIKQSMGKIASAIVLADKITWEITKSFPKNRLKYIAEFSENSEKVMSLISTALDAFEKLQKFKKVPAKSFQNLKTDIIAAVKAIEEATKSFKDMNLLAKAVVFSDTVKSVMEAIGSALDVLDKMPDSYATHSVAVFKNLAADMKLAVVELAKVGKSTQELQGYAKNFALTSGDVSESISKALEVFAHIPDAVDLPTGDVFGKIADLMKRMVVELKRISKGFSDDMQEALKNFAGTASTVAGAIGDALGVFANVPMLIDLPAGEIFTPISTLIGNMATALGKAAAEVDGTLLKAAKAFALAVGPVVSVIGEAVSAMRDIATFVPPTKEEIALVAQSIKDAAIQISLVATEAKFSTKEATKITEFSNAAVAAMGAIRAANETFKETTEEILSEGQYKKKAPSITDAVKQIADSMAAVAKVAAGYDTGLIQKVQNLSNAASAVVGVVKSVFELMDPQDLSQAGASEMVKNVTQAITIALGVIKSAMVPFADSFKITGATLIGNLVIGMNSQQAALKTAVDAVISEIKRLGGAMDVLAGLQVGGSGDAGGTYAGRTRAQIQKDIDAENRSIAWFTSVKNPTPQQKTLLAAHQKKLKELQAEYAAAPYAKGGLFRAGQLMLVGEKGPELIQPNFSGNVIPNSAIGSVFGDSPMLRIEHVISGDVSSMTAAQVAGILNSNNNQLASAIVSTSKKW